MRLTVQNYGYCVLCVFLAVLAKSVLFVSWILATWCLKSAKDLQETLHSSQDDLLAKLCGLLAECASFWPNSRLLDSLARFSPHVTASSLREHSTSARDSGTIDREFLRDKRQTAWTPKMTVWTPKFGCVDP